jgi:hypothetical protein
MVDYKHETAHADGSGPFAGRRSVMCYDKTFLKSWAKQKVQKREQIEPEVERARPDVQPISRASEHEVTGRKEVERELDEVV